VRADAGRRRGRVRHGAARGAGDARAHAGGHLDPRLRPGEEHHSPPRRAHRRHAVHRRRGPAGSAGEHRRDRRRTRRHALRQPHDQADEAPRRHARLSGPWCGQHVRQESLQGDGLHDRRAEEVQLRPPADEPRGLQADRDGRSAGGPGILRPRRDPQSPGPCAARRGDAEEPRATVARRGARAGGAGCPAARRPRGHRLRGGPPAACPQHRPGRHIRHVGRLDARARPPHRGHRRGGGRGGGGDAARPDRLRQRGRLPSGRDAGPRRPGRPRGADAADHGPGPRGVAGGESRRRRRHARGGRRAHPGGTRRRARAGKPQPAAGSSPGAAGGVACRPAGGRPLRGGLPLGDLGRRACCSSRAARTSTISSAASRHGSRPGCRPRPILQPPDLAGRGAKSGPIAGTD